jgi:hypothetical protein
MTRNAKLKPPSFIWTNLCIAIVGKTIASFFLEKRPPAPLLLKASETYKVQNNCFFGNAISAKDNNCCCLYLEFSGVSRCCPKTFSKAILGRNKHAQMPDAIAHGSMAAGDRSQL